MDLFYIIIFTIVIWLISLIVYKKNKFLSLGNLYLFFYAFIFLVSIKLYVEDNVHDFHGLNGFGFAHLILFLFLFALPILRYPSQDVPFIETNKGLVRFLYWFTIVFSLVAFYDIYQNFSSGIVLLFTDSSYGNEAYMELREEMDVVKSAGRARNYLSVLSGQAHHLSIFLFLYSLIDRNSSTLEKVLLGVSVGSVFMDAISQGSRFGIVMSLLQFFFFYFFIRNYLPKYTRRIVNTISIFAGIVIVGSVIAITSSRASSAARSSDDMFMYYDAYISEGVLFYAKYAFDPGQIRDGERTFPLVKKAIGYKDVADSYAKRLRKFNRMKINEVNFVTFVGDFMLDYGPFLGSIIMLIMVFFFKANIKLGKVVTFPSLCLVFLLILILDGFSLYTLTDTGGNLTFFLFIFIYFIAKANKIKISYSKTN